MCTVMLSALHSFLVLGAVKRMHRKVYSRTFREWLGELTPRNLDHPVPVGLVDIGGRRALIYGHPLTWALLTPCSCSPPHRLLGRQWVADRSLASRACGMSSMLTAQIFFIFFYIDLLTVFFPLHITSPQITFDKMQPYSHYDCA